MDTPTPDKQPNTLKKSGPGSSAVALEFDYSPAYLATWEDAVERLGVNLCVDAKVIAARDDCGVKVVKNRNGLTGYHEWDADGLVVI